MVHVRFINDQETVVTVPVRPDVDRWVLAVMPVKIKLELLRDTLCVNGGRDTDAAFTQHEQDRFVHIVVDKHDRTPGRLYQIGGELVRIENLAVIKNAFDRGQGSTHEKIYLLGMLSDSPFYNPQIQISAESETKRSIFREKDKTKRSKKESAQHSKSRNKSFVMTSVSAL